MGYYLGILPLVGWRCTLGISVENTISNPRNAYDKFPQCFFVFGQSCPIPLYSVTACSRVNSARYRHWSPRSRGTITNHSSRNGSTKVANSVTPTKGNNPPMCLPLHHPTIYDTIPFRTILELGCPGLS